MVIVIYNLATGGEMINISKQATEAFFTKPTIMEFSNPIEYTRDNWLAYIASQDDCPLPNEPGYDEHIAALNAAFDRQSVDGLIRCDRSTRVYCERIV